MAKVEFIELMAVYRDLEQALVRNDDGHWCPLFESPLDCIRVVLSSEPENLDSLRDLEFATKSEAIWKDLLSRSMNPEERHQLESIKAETSASRSTDDWHKLRLRFEGLTNTVPRQVTSSEIAGTRDLLFPDPLINRLREMADELKPKPPTEEDVAFASFYSEAFSKVTKIEIQGNSGYYIPGEPFEKRIKELHGRMRKSALFHHDVRITRKNIVEIDGHPFTDPNSCKVLLTLAMVCPDRANLLFERDVFTSAIGRGIIDANRSFATLMERTRKKLPFFKCESIERLKRISGVNFTEVSASNEQIKSMIAAIGRNSRLTGPRAAA
jgi:hypothetical protein